MAEEKTFTQEEVNALVGKARLEGKDIGRAEIYKEHEGWMSPADVEKKTEDLSKQVADLNQSFADKTAEYADKTAEFEKQIADKDSKIANYEMDSVKTKIALETGIPYQMADKLSGTTEEEVRADAEKMAEFMTKPSAPPMAGTEGKEMDGVTAEFLRLNPNLKL